MNHQLRTNPHSDVPEPVDQPQEVVPEILSTLTLEEARDYLLDTAIERAPVADADRVFGVISLGDLNDALARGADPDQPTVTLFGDAFWEASATTEPQPPVAPTPTSGDRRTPLSGPRSDRRNGTFRTTIAEIIGNRRPAARTASRPVWK